MVRKYKLIKSYAQKSGDIELHDIQKEQDKAQREKEKSKKYIDVKYSKAGIAFRVSSLQTYKKLLQRHVLSIENIYVVFNTVLFNVSNKFNLTNSPTLKTNTRPHNILSKIRELNIKNLKEDDKGEYEIPKDIVWEGFFNCNNKLKIYYSYKFKDKDIVQATDSKGVLLKDITINMDCNNIEFTAIITIDDKIESKEMKFNYKDLVGILNTAKTKSGENALVAVDLDQPDLKNIVYVKTIIDLQPFSEMGMKHMISLQDFQNGKEITIGMDKDYSYKFTSDKKLSTDDSVINEILVTEMKTLMLNI